MRLDPPLSNLLDRCMTLCVAECCGLDAYDINPIHVASYLLLYRGAPDLREVAQIRTQLESLKANYGSAGAADKGASFDDLNQKFSGAEIDAFVERLSSALDQALLLLADPKSRGATSGRPHD